MCFTDLTNHLGDTVRDIVLIVGDPVLQQSWTFDTDPGWSTEDEWTFGQPTGGGGEYGNPDPTSGHTGDNVYGYNLNGDYANNLPQRHLTSTSIDCTGLYGVQLKFWRYLGVEQPAYDHAYVRVSNDGSNWITVWENTAEITDSSWVAMDLDISAVAGDQSTVYLRWTMGTTDTAWRYCGWNIDDVEIWGVSLVSYCPGDLDHNGVVNVTDLLQLLGAWGSSDPAADINEDGTVNVSDLLILLGAWGQC